MLSLVEVFTKIKQAPISQDPAYHFNLARWWEHHAYHFPLPSFLPAPLATFSSRDRRRSRPLAAGQAVGVEAGAAPTALGTVQHGQARTPSTSSCLHIHFCLHIGWLLVSCIFFHISWLVVWSWPVNCGVNLSMVVYSLVRRLFFVDLQEFVNLVTNELLWCTHCKFSLNYRLSAVKISCFWRYHQYVLHTSVMTELKTELSVTRNGRLAKEVREIRF
jgi:hypothetical protein